MSDTLEANTFGLSDDDFEGLLEQSEHDIEELLEQDGHDIEELLDLTTADDKQANHYSELVARQWDTPEGDWWP
jgi:hypothetical protein